MKYHRIFISYRREGGDITAKLICEALKNRGYTTFYDYDALKGGVFDDQIRQEIDNCTDMIVVLPENALDRCQNKNDWVRQEIAQALSLGKNIVPVMLQGFEFPVTLPDDIDKLRFYNGVRFYMEFFDAVIEKIEEKLSPIPDKTDAAKHRKSHADPRSGSTPPPKPTVKPERDKPAAAGGSGRTPLAVLATLAWTVALILLILTLVFAAGDVDLALICLFPGITAAYAGFACFTLWRFGAGRKALRLMMWFACAPVLLMLLTGIMLTPPFFLICELPFIVLFSILGVAFFVLGRLPEDSPYVLKRKNCIKKKIFTVISVLSAVLLAAILFFITYFVMNAPYAVEDAYWADKGNAGAQCRVGSFYADHLDDHKTAIEWYEKALNGGNNNAARYLGAYYLDGVFLPRDYAKAVDLYMYYGSRFPQYADDELLPVYRAMRPSLLDMAIDSDTLTSLTPDTAYYLGTVYLTGIRNDPPEGTAEEFAARLLQWAVDNGHTAAAFVLGNCYEQGNGVPQDPDKALELYELARDRGYPYRINQLYS